MYSSHWPIAIFPFSYVEKKSYENSFNNWIDKKEISLHKMSCYPKPNSPSKNKIKVELALSSYAKKKKKKNLT